MMVRREQEDITAMTAMHLAIDKGKPERALALLKETEGVLLVESTSPFPTGLYKFTF
jgi:hypothetical protein